VAAGGGRHHRRGGIKDKRNGAVGMKTSKQQHREHQWHGGMAAS